MLRQKEESNLWLDFIKVGVQQMLLKLLSLQSVSAVQWKTNAKAKHKVFPGHSWGITSQSLDYPLSDYF
jgi:hypothetical protein